MKIIDLLNKIANGEIPSKIKYKNLIYEYLETSYGTGYVHIDGFNNYHWFYSDKTDSTDYLNETVEIIEEQQDIDIQNIEEIKFRESDKEYLGFGVDLAHSKINELVQAVKQLDKNKVDYIKPSSGREAD